MTSVTFPPAIGGDGSTYTDDANSATGMMAGGFRQRLIPMLVQSIAITNFGATKAGEAAASADAAAASAATAAAAPGTSATSTTSLAIGAGAKTLTIQAGKSLVVGMSVKVANTASPGDWMHGDVTAYNSATGSLTVNVTNVSGSGTVAAWTVSLSSPVQPLPTQTGKAGKALKTDGTSPYWGDSGVATVNATVTDNAMLAAGNLYVPVQMAALGKSVTLPDARTLGLGGPLFIVDNTKGGYPCGIRDNAGTLLMAVAAGGEAFVSLKDNSTAAGIWSVTGSNLEPGLITIDNTFSSTYASTVLAPFVALDNNTSIHFAALSSGFAAFVVDNTGKVLTTPVTVSATASHAPCQAFKISATQAIVFYGIGTTHSCVVLTLSGTSPSLSLAVGTAATFAPSMGGTNWGGEDFVSTPKIAQLSSSLYLASYTPTPNTNVVAVSVSGSTITVGSAASIITASSVQTSTTTYALTATTALVLYLSGSGPYNINAVVVSVSGTTCTVGAPAATSVMAAVSGPVVSALLSPTKALITANPSASSVQSAAVTVNGAAVSWGGLSTIEASVDTGGLAYAFNTTTRYNPHLFPLSANTAMLWYLDSGGISRAVVLTESGGTVTAGTILYRSISSATSVDFGVMLPQGSPTEFMAIKQAGATNSYKHRAVAHKISGNSISAGQSTYLDGISPFPTADLLGVTRLSGGDYAVVFNGTGNGVVSNMPIFRSNGDAINYRGGIKVPALLAGSNGAQQAAFSNRLVLLGYSLYQGTTLGVSTYQLRLLNVEIAA
jgi:hypothetical protein